MPDHVFCRKPENYGRKIQLSRLNLGANKEKTDYKLSYRKNTEQNTTNTEIQMTI
jgi:hypothetical protein